jgi:hypothetical protein
VRALDLSLWWKFGRTAMRPCWLQARLKERVRMVKEVKLQRLLSNNRRYFVEFHTVEFHGKMRWKGRIIMFTLISIIPVNLDKMPHAALYYSSTEEVTYLSKRYFLG